MKNSAVQSAVTQNINMLNKLHMAMIELYKGDSRRIQHFCKVHSYARLIAQMENVDYKTLFIIETAALTHEHRDSYMRRKIWRVWRQVAGKGRTCTS